MSRDEDPWRLNRAMWNERAELHPDSEMYRGTFGRLERGGDCLLPIEGRELGDVRNLRILHLQCHLGQDSLSLVRRGASVTGVDFAPAAIEAARQKSAALGLEAEFVEGDVVALDEHPELRLRAGTFDGVFAS